MAGERERERQGKREIERERELLLLSGEVKLNQGEKRAIESEGRGEKKKRGNRRERIR